MGFRASPPAQSGPRPASRPSVRVPPPLGGSPHVCADVTCPSPAAHTPPPLHAQTQAVGRSCHTKEATRGARILHVLLPRPSPPPQAAGTGVAASKADLSHLCSVVARAAPAPRLHGAAQVLPIHTCVADLPHFLTSPPHPSPPPPPRGKKPSFRLVLSLGPGRSPRNGRRCCTGCVVRSDLGLRRLFPGRKWGREGEPAVLDAGEPGLGSLVSETSLLFGFSN